MIEKMSSDLKVSLEDNNILQKKLQKLARESIRNKLESFNKENILTQQIKDCSDKLEFMNRNSNPGENEKEADIIMLEVK